MGPAHSTSKTIVAVSKNFPHAVFAKCDAESLKLTEMDEDDEFAIGGSLNLGYKRDAKVKPVEQGPEVEANISAEAKANMQKKTKCHKKFCAKVIAIGFSTVQPGEYLEFDVPVDNTNAVYITIYANNENDEKLHPLSVNLPKDLNTNILVQDNGQVVQSADKDLWRRKKFK